MAKSGITMEDAASMSWPHPIRNAIAATAASTPQSFGVIARLFTRKLSMPSWYAPDTASAIHQQRYFESPRNRERSERFPQGLPAVRGPAARPQFYWHATGGGGPKRAPKDPASAASHPHSKGSQPSEVRPRARSSAGMQPEEGVLKGLRKILRAQRAVFRSPFRTPSLARSD